MQNTLYIFDFCCSLHTYLHINCICIPPCTGALYARKTKKKKEKKKKKKQEGRKFFFVLKRNVTDSGVQNEKRNEPAKLTTTDWVP